VRRQRSLLDWVTRAGALGGGGGGSAVPDCDCTSKISELLIEPYDGPHLRREIIMSRLSGLRLRFEKYRRIHGALAVVGHRQHCIRASDCAAEVVAESVTLLETAIVCALVTPVRFTIIVMRIVTVDRTAN